MSSEDEEKNLTNVPSEDEQKGMTNVSPEDEESLRQDVNYLRFLLESGLSEEEITVIAKDKNPKLEVCFSEEACISQSKTLERGKFIVLIS